jgi:hypothetical protein
MSDIVETKFETKFCKSKSLCQCGCGRVTKKNASRYASQVCQKNAEYAAYIAEWVRGGKPPSEDSKHIRRYLMERCDGKCERCGWGEVNGYTGVSPLQRHHRDGRWDNNRESNLCMLCPNCHALTENFGGANRGRGREHRRQRYLSAKLVSAS